MEVIDCDIARIGPPGSFISDIPHPISCRDIHSNSPPAPGSGSGCGDMTLYGETRRRQCPTAIGAEPKMEAGEDSSGAGFEIGPANRHLDDPLGPEDLRGISRVFGRGMLHELAAWCCVRSFEEWGACLCMSKKYWHSLMD